MSEEKITYRGASKEQSEDTRQMHEGKHTEHVSYRGIEGDVEVGHEKHTQEVQYRGAKGEVEL
ncbi:MAG: hypothetical protein P1U81_02720 [Verrucomicrobiales bacterium]|nr:hypothetical protein [Verrucomicrobiales bacterium]